MRYRICDNTFTDQRIDEKSDIYRKFQFQFNNLFNTNEIAKNNDDFEKMYVPDKEFEYEIDNFLQSINSTARFCVGYTGIGKTTAIRHCFNLGISAAPVLTTPSRLMENKRMVIFPTFLDGYVQLDENSFDLPSRIAAVCTALELAHPELQYIFKTSSGLKEFYNFIRDHTPHILEQGGDVYDLTQISDEEYTIKRLNNAMKFSPLDYNACKLKYYILKKYDIYDRLVIILDDVETMPENFQERIIIDYLHLFDCMQNTDYPEGANYCVNLLISLRPHTYRIFSNGIRGRMLDAYPIEAAILKKNSVDLAELFQKRFDYYTSLTPKMIGNPETWRASYNELMLINCAFDGQYKNMISNLCFMNVRSSLTQYAKIFANRFWIQRNHIKTDVFAVMSSHFTINNITVTRAIGCGNSRIFTGEYNPTIPNFFCTTPDIDYSVLCLLVMQYFRKKMHSFSGGTVEYGLDAQPLGIVYEEWRNVFDDEEHVKQLKCALQYLFECKILRKSIIDFDDYQTLDKLESINEASRLYISPRGIELMDMLERDSILLEMLRECAWRDYSNHESSYCKECSYELVQNGEGSKLYIDLLEYVETFCQAEEEFFFFQGSTNLYEYRKLFGSTLVVERLMCGVEKSLRNSGSMYNPIITEKFYQLKKQISESEKILWGD